MSQVCLLLYILPFEFLYIHNLNLKKSLTELKIFISNFTDPLNYYPQFPPTEIQYSLEHCKKATQMPFNLFKKICPQRHLFHTL